MHAKAKLEGLVRDDSFVFALPLSCFFLSLSICLAWFDEHFVQGNIRRG